MVRTLGRICLAACWGCLVAGAAVVGTGCDDDDGGTPPPAADGGPMDVPAVETAVEAAPDMADVGPVTTYALTVLHTNDIHSHLQGHAPEADYTPGTLDDDDTIGGFARIATAIGGYRAAAAAQNQDVLLLDGGDFTMGTLFELAATTAAAELRLMQAVGYDAAAMGNHELDWTPAGLIAILKAARMANVTLPVLASNVKYDATSPADDELEPLLTRKFVKTLPGGLKVGFFGLLGDQAARFAPTAAPLTFDKIATAAKTLSDELRQVDKVDLVVALSHSGIASDGKGEDRDLAAALPGAIDLIISGHTHQKLEQPVVVGKTIIVTAGSYGEYLGRLGLEVDKSGGVVTAVRVKEYTLLPINDKVAGAPQIQGAIDQVIAGISAGLASSGLAYDKTVGQTSVDIKSVPFAENGLGDLVTDAFLASAQKLDPTDPPLFAVEASGQIRADILKGKTGAIWFADLFRLTPIGLGPDRRPGSPLVSYWFTGRDIKAALEIGAGAQALGDDAYTLQFSGLQADYDQSRSLFQKVTGARVMTQAGLETIDLSSTTKCYKVVTTLYLAGFFNLAGSLTGVPITAREKDCVTNADLFARLIDVDPATAGVQELKNYQAILGFVSAHPDSDMDGVPNLPASYGMSAGRVTVTP
jgi:5'-nucleotidase/UDP-sugar diphosphatase